MICAIICEDLVVNNVKKECQILTGVIGFNRFSSAIERIHN